MIVPEDGAIEIAALVDTLITPSCTKVSSLSCAQVDKQ